MSRKFLVVVGALIAAQVFSGCYLVRELDWSKDTVKLGDTAKATISLQSPEENVRRLGGVGADEGRFFLAALGESSSLVNFKRPTFDSKDITNQKVRMDENAALGERLNNETCVFLPSLSRRARGGEGAGIWSTPGDVGSGPRKLVDVSLKGKVNSSGESGFFVGLVLSGRWIDDGDGVPEDPDSSDDEIECTGSTTTSFLIK